MRYLHTQLIGQPDLHAGHFNRCEHTFLQCEPGRWQTLSVALPNGKVVTFSFVPGNGNEMECVDIHATVGKPFKYQPANAEVHYVQHAIGFSGNGDTFDTRQIKRPTSLITLLLAHHHHE